MTHRPAGTRPHLKPLSLAVLLCVAAWQDPALAQDTSADNCEATPDGQLAECAVQPGAAVVLPDWVPRRQVPKALQDDQCLRCGGRYIDPLAGQDLGKSPALSDIDAKAGSSELRGDTVVLSDGVTVSQGYRRLRADQATLDRVERSAQLQGNIELREPGLLLTGSAAQIYARSGEARIQDSQFLLHEQGLRGQAGELSRDEDGILHVHQGEISYCPPGHNDWLIQADELALDVEEGLGTARGARIRVADVPVFYAPWLRFPIDDRRRTGFLWPDIGSDSRGGVDVAVPTYLNLAPNYDLLYAPRYIRERGLNHEIRGRYLSPQLGSWTVGGAFMNNDKRYKDEYPQERNHDRWLGVIKHDGLLNKRWRSTVDYSRASDVNYKKDLQTSSLDLKRETALLQLGSLDYLGDRWLGSVELQQFQSLADDLSNDYKKLPQITGRYRPTGEPFAFDPVFTAQYSSFDTDDDRVVGDRLYAEAGVTYPMLWTYGFLNSTAKYRYLGYDLNSHPDFSSRKPDAGAAMVNLDGGLYFDRQTSFAGRGLLQTLEPRLYYLYSEYEDQTGQPDFDSAELTFTYNQLFRETRFSGRDRIDDADQLSVGITTRFIDESDGREEFSASVGQIFYFRDREVRLQPDDPPLTTGGSEMAAELTFYPNERLTLRTSLVHDPYSNKVNSGNFQTSYLRDDGSIYNIGYAYRRALTTVTEQVPSEEAQFSAYVPTGRNWRVFMAINYSLEANTSVEDMFGVEYDSCCWKVRLLHLRYYDTAPGERNPDFDDPRLQREHSTQIQIVLKGMGGFGSRASSIMKDMIRGFTDGEY